MGLNNRAANVNPKQDADAVDCGAWLNRLGES